MKFKAREYCKGGARMQYASEVAMCLHEQEGHMCWVHVSMCRCVCVRVCVGVCANMSLGVYIYGYWTYAIYGRYSNTRLHACIHTPANKAYIHDDSCTRHVYLTIPSIRIERGVVVA